MFLSIPVIHPSNWFKLLKGFSLFWRWLLITEIINKHCTLQCSGQVLWLFRHPFVMPNCHVLRYSINLNTWKNVLLLPEIMHFYLYACMFSVIHTCFYFYTIDDTEGICDTTIASVHGLYSKSLMYTDA